MKQGLILFMLIIVPTILTSCGGDDESYDLTTDLGLSQAFCNYLFKCNECNFPDSEQAVGRCADAMVEGINKLSEDEKGENFIECGNCMIDALSKDCSALMNFGNCSELCSETTGGVIMDSYKEHNGEEGWYTCKFCSSSMTDIVSGKSAGMSCKEDGMDKAECECDEGIREGTTFSYANVCTDESAEEEAMAYCAGGDLPQ